MCYLESFLEHKIQQKSNSVVKCQRCRCIRQTGSSSNFRKKTKSNFTDMLRHNPNDFTPLYLTYLY